MGGRLPKSLEGGRGFALGRECLGLGVCLAISGEIGGGSGGLQPGTERLEPGPCPGIGEGLCDGGAPARQERIGDEPRVRVVLAGKRGEGLRILGGDHRLGRGPGCGRHIVLGAREGGAEEQQETEDRAARHRSSPHAPPDESS